MSKELNNEVNLSSLVQGISAADLHRKEFLPLKWVVDGLIPEGLTVLAGAPKIGKSFLCWNIALAVAHGGVALSTYEVSEAKNVLYFALEDPQRQIQNRLRMIQAELGYVPPENLYIYTAWPFPFFNLDAESDPLDEWEKVIEKHNAELVIVDTLHHVKPPLSGGTSYEVDYTVLSPVQQMIHRLGISMLLVTHTRKAVDVDNPFNRIQGSTAVQAACDTMMLLVKENGDKMLHVNGREVLPVEINVEVREGVFVAVDMETYQENKLSDIRSDILKVVRESGETGITLKGIVDALPDRTDNSVRLTVRRMVNEQIYQLKPRGKYYHTLPREFQTELDEIPL